MCDSVCHVSPVVTVCVFVRVRMSECVRVRMCACRLVCHYCGLPVCVSVCGCGHDGDAASHFFLNLSTYYLCVRVCVRVVVVVVVAMVMPRLVVTSNLFFFEIAAACHWQCTTRDLRWWDGVEIDSFVCD